MAVSLSKGQRVSLEKNGGGGLSKIRMGVGWDPVVAPKKVVSLAACLVVVLMTLTWMPLVCC